MERRILNVEDLDLGDVVRFYDKGFRFAIVTKIQKKRNKKRKKISYIIHTDRYGKIPLEKIAEVYIYENKKTVLKPLISDLFI